MNALSQYITLYRQHGSAIDSHSPELFNKWRVAALSHLLDARLPQKGDESYEALSVEEMFAPDFGVNVSRLPYPVDAAASFRCGVPNVSTLLAFVVNDSFVPSAALQRNLPAGVEVMSLAQAAATRPDSIRDYLGALSPLSDATVALNALLLQDGVYIHIGRDVVVDRPVQLVNIFNAATPFLATRRLLVVMESGAKASILCCDHSQQTQVDYLSNAVTEIFLADNASLEFCELEESSARTRRLSHLYCRQMPGSRLTVNGSTLIGGVTRNNYDIEARGDDTATRLTGMAVAGASQIVDNFTCVRHLGAGGTSDQLFKYILDDEAVGAFYGRIIVDGAAKHTASNQSNRNILASRTARMYTRPQLEIYCDDVKCSHGATVGQLDASALFYMRSRGIPEAEARLMLMQAFMSDVIDTVGIPALRSRLLLLTEKRLAGESVLCADCGVCP